MAFWNERVFHLVMDSPPESSADYRGLTGREVVAWTLQYRRNKRLSDVLPDERTREVLPSLYRDLSSGAAARYRRL